MQLPLRLMAHIVSFGDVRTGLRLLQTSCASWRQLSEAGSVARAAAVCSGLLTPDAVLSPPLSFPAPTGWDAGGCHDLWRTVCRIKQLGLRQFDWAARSSAELAWTADWLERAIAPSVASSSSFGVSLPARWALLVPWRVGDVLGYGGDCPVALLHADVLLWVSANRRDRLPIAVDLCFELCDATPKYAGDGCPSFSSAGTVSLDVSLTMDQESPAKEKVLRRMAHVECTFRLGAHDQRRECMDLRVYDLEDSPTTDSQRCSVPTVPALQQAGLIEFDGMDVRQVHTLPILVTMAVTDSG